MDALTGLLLILLVPVRSAPVFSDDLTSLREAAKSAQALATKIDSGIPIVYGMVVNGEGLSLDPPNYTLQAMAVTLGIPPSPVLLLSEDFSLEERVRRMVSGVCLMTELLLVLKEQVSGLTELHGDLRDLLTHLTKMKVAAQLQESDQTPESSLSFHPVGDYEVQVATHLTLSQLRTFCRDLVRSLRLLVDPRKQEVSLF